MNYPPAQKEAPRFVFPPSAHDPNRPPAWRWERARFIRANGKFGRSKDDKYTILIKKYQDAREACRKTIDFYKLSLAYPGLYWADQTYHDTAHHGAGSRWSLEARILSDQDPEDIAQRCDITLEMLSWYEKAFFDVRKKLDCLDWIVNVVMGESVHRGISENNYGLIWKLYGYHYGPVMLESFIASVNKRQHIHSTDQIESVLKDEYKDTITRRATLAARTVKLNNFNSGTFFEAYSRLMELAKANAGGGDASAMILDHVKAMLESLPFKMKRNYEGVDGERLKRYDEASAELRAHELISVTVGRETDEIKLIPHLKFPEATANEANQQGS